MGREQQHLGAMPAEFAGMWLYTCSRRHRIEVMQGASTFRRKLMGLPANPLLTAIPHDARDSWRSRPTPELVRRLEILCASGPRPAERVQAVRLMYDRAVRAAWETYVFCAFACGLFEGQRGKELRGRFGSRSDDDFRSAMAECQACWFLAGRLGFPVSGKAPGRGNKMLDMKAVIDDQDVGVEVKAPYREPPPAGQAWSDHDGEALAQCLDAANKATAAYRATTYERAEKDIEWMIENHNAVFIRINTSAFRDRMKGYYETLIKEGKVKREVYDAVNAMR